MTTHRLSAISPHSGQSLIDFAPDLTACLREYVVNYRGEFDTQTARGACPLVSGRAYARSFDGLFSALLPATHATLASLNRWVDCSLVAVGSYGRGVPSPRSDLDVRLLVDELSDDEGAVVEQIAQSILYPLWDAGCSLGHQVLDIPTALSLARSDLSTATALLDARHVAGDPARSNRLFQSFFDTILADGPSNFIERLREEQRSRHDMMGGSLYLLEPDVKRSPGSLRDLDIARWALRASRKPGVNPIQGRSHTDWIDQLVELEWLAPTEAEALIDAEKFLLRVRARLHVRGERRSDRLTFDAQEDLGRVMGEAGTGETSAIAAERLMQRYYGHARTVTRLVERVLDRCDPPQKPVRAGLHGVSSQVAPGVVLRDGFAALPDGCDLSKQPLAAFELYVAALRSGLRVHPVARDLVARACEESSFCARLRALPEASRLFLQLLTHVADRAVQSPGGKLLPGGSILREIHDAGLLLAMIPEFRPVVGRVHHDIYHVYTVDVHSVAAVDRLRALARGDFAHDQPLGCRLAGDVPRPLPLYVATLLHDVGKGHGSVGHGERGAATSVDVCGRLGLSREDADEVRWLVSEHLTMYHLATRRDLDDPATVADFARRIVGSGGSPLERLQHLYLLTVADISTTSPTAMTTWKARMLDDLFLATSHHLAAPDALGEQHDEILGRIRDEAANVFVKALEQSGGLPPGDEAELARLSAFADFLAHMPKAYFFAHRGAHVAAHGQVVLRRAASNLAVVIDAVPARIPDSMDLCIAALDRPGLLASIACALTANRLDVLSAQVFVRPLGGQREAVDVFTVRRAGLVGADGAEALSSRELAQLGADLDGLLNGAVDPVALLLSRRGPGRSDSSRPQPEVATTVEIDDRASRRFTVIDVYAKDAPCLLFTLANTLHSLSLSIARSKIATEGASVADSFYVTELDGQKVSDPARHLQIQHALLSRIDKLNREGFTS